MGPFREYRNVTDSWEMKAFVARSRTKAVGALDYIGGPIGAKINLRDDYGFGRDPVRPWRPVHTQYPETGRPLQKNA